MSAAMKDLLFALYNNLIIGELAVFAILLLAWAGFAIRRGITKSFRRGYSFRCAPPSLRRLHHQ
jgi:hypothetical protein